MLRVVLQLCSILLNYFFDTYFLSLCNKIWHIWLMTVPFQNHVCIHRLWKIIEWKELFFVYFCIQNETFSQCDNHSGASKIDIFLTEIKTNLSAGFHILHSSNWIQMFPLPITLAAYPLEWNSWIEKGTWMSEFLVCVSLYNALNFSWN